MAKKKVNISPVGVSTLTNLCGNAKYCKYLLSTLGRY
jgi:hypothetical protein